MRTGELGVAETSIVSKCIRFSIIRLLDDEPYRQTLLKSRNYHKSEVKGLFSEWSENVHIFTLI